MVAVRLFITFVCETETVESDLCGCDVAVTSAAFCLAERRRSGGMRHDLSTNRCSQHGMALAVPLSRAERLGPVWLSLCVGQKE